MATLNPDDDRRKELSWTLDDNVPLQLRFAHQQFCNDVDACSNLEQLRAIAKSVNALYIGTRCVYTRFGASFPTNLDGV